MTSNPKAGFVEWLIKQMDERRWNAQTLAENAEVAPATISNVLNGKRSVGPDLLRGLARAFKMSQIDIFTRAGLIDEATSKDFILAANYVRRIAEIDDDEERQATVAMVDALLLHIIEKRKARKPSYYRNKASSESD